MTEGCPLAQEVRDNLQTTVCPLLWGGAWGGFKEGEFITGEARKETVIFEGHLCASTFFWICCLI